MRIMSVREQNSVFNGVGTKRPWFDLSGRFTSRLLSRLNHGRLIVETPSGQRVERRAALLGPEAILVLHDWRAVRRVFAGGAMGFAEGYMAGEWSSPDPVAIFELFSANAVALGDVGRAKGPFRLVNALSHRLRDNAPGKARKNIAAHYDLGNDFYSAWLDETMTYSSARFSSPTPSTSG